MIAANEAQEVANALLQAKLKCDIKDSEIKWQRVDKSRVERYNCFVDTFFDLLASHQMAFRIMFTENKNIPDRYKREEKQGRYHKLYYQFIKHVFGLQYIYSDIPVYLEFFFDWFPEKKEQNERYKSYIYGLQSLEEFKQSNIVIDRDAIAEVDSKRFVLLQAVDLILGAISWRLNHGHKYIEPGKTKRGNRTIAKEMVYKHINKKIRELRKGFNISMTTGLDDDLQNKFYHKYRHWSFKPK